MSCLRDLIREARGTPAVDELFKKVETKTPIDFKIVPAGYWASQTVAGKTTILVAPTNHPASALAHELLHAKLKIEGYRQHPVYISMDIKKDFLMPIGEMLDNELQHHKMFEDFVSAGLDPKTFYHEDDSAAFDDVRAQLSGLKRDGEPEDYLLLYATVMAPGGMGDGQERTELKRLFEKQCRARTWNILRKIEAAIEAWKGQTDLNPAGTILRVFRILGGYEKTWVGVSENFPYEGRLVSKPFTIEDVQNHHASMRVDLRKI